MRSNVVGHMILSFCRLETVHDVASVASYLFPRLRQPTREVEKMFVRQILSGVLRPEEHCFHCDVRDRNTHVAVDEDNVVDLTIVHESGHVARLDVSLDVISGVRFVIASRSRFVR